MRQAISHRNPRVPVMTKAGRQPPKYLYKPITSSGAIAPPIDEPLSKSATAQPLSFLGNHSATAFVAAGQLADSPAPSRKRNNAKLRRPPASDVSIAAIEYQMTVIVSPFRVPMRSINRPETVCPIEYAARNAITIVAKFWLFQPYCCFRYGARTESVCRSM